MKASCVVCGAELPDGPHHQFESPAIQFINVPHLVYVAVDYCSLDCVQMLEEAATLEEQRYLKLRARARTISNAKRSIKECLRTAKEQSKRRDDQGTDARRAKRL